MEIVKGKRIKLFGRIIWLLGAMGFLYFRGLVDLSHPTNNDIVFLRLEMLSGALASVGVGMQLLSYYSNSRIKTVFVSLFLLLFLSFIFYKHLKVESLVKEVIAYDMQLKK